jgi:hypothetical protein
MLDMIDGLATAWDEAKARALQGNGTLLFSDPIFRDLLYVFPPALEAARSFFHREQTPTKFSFCAGCWTTPEMHEKRTESVQRLHGRRTYAGRGGAGSSSSKVRHSTMVTVDTVNVVIDGLRDMTLSPPDVDMDLDANSGSVNPSPRPGTAPQTTPRVVSGQTNARASYTCMTCGATFALRRTLGLHRNRNGCMAILNP